MIISIGEYAKLKGKSKKTVQEKCQRGTLRTAFKIGGRWVIDSEEEYTDFRSKKNCGAFVVPND